MKSVLIIFLFAFSATAFANDHKTTPPPPLAENNGNNGSETKKEAAKAIKFQENKEAKEVKAKPAPQKDRNAAAHCTSVEGSRFNLSAYFVEIVNSNNIKLVKLLLE